MILFTKGYLRQSLVMSEIIAAADENSISFSCNKTAPGVLPASNAYHWEQTKAHLFNDKQWLPADIV